MKSYPRPKPLILCSRCVSKRWVSHDKSSMTKEALTAKIQAGLGENVKLDSDKKNITTAQGSLPISPLFDPAWVKSHQRERKSSVTRGQPLNRFRRKLVVNPYAQALGTPIRECQVTLTHLPKHFLQDWEIVKHPSTGKPYFAPGPQAFEDVVPQLSDIEKSEKLEKDTSSKMAESNEGAASIEQARPKRSPVTAYSLNSGNLVSIIGARQLEARILGHRHGMAMDKKIRAAAWRDDMADVLLKMLRREAVDGLVFRSGPDRQPVNKFIEPCDDWSMVDEVKRKMGILWIPDDPKNGQDTTRYATFDRIGASYERKLVVHNLRWLLGEVELSRLRKSSAMFRDNHLLVLRHWNSHSMRKLHQLLWRLHGYLDAPDKPQVS